MLGVRVVFWASAAALAWTHVGYPIFIAAVARLRPRAPNADDGYEPSVTVVVAARNEQATIGERLANLEALDYPAGRLDVVVVSDGSTDETAAIARTFESRLALQVLERPGEGKVASQNAGFRRASGDVIALTDANTSWAPEALRRLVRNLADPGVGYVCGQLRLEAPDGSNREGLYWRYEMWVRRCESVACSITAGNGSIYCVRRSDYVEQNPRYGHDLGFPYLMVQRGKRAIYEPAAVAVEPTASEIADEYRRKTRMMAQSWGHILSGRMFSRTVPPLYLVELVSHRVLRYASGLFHVALVASSIVLVQSGVVYQIAAVGQALVVSLAILGRLGVRMPGALLAYYYLAVTASTLTGLVAYLRRGAPTSWRPVAGTR